jgi:hypothetical protein
MKRTMAVASLTFALATGLSCGTALAGPSMSTKWSNTGLSLERCKERAEEAVRDAGFRSLKVLKFSIFAERGDYSIMVRCISDKKMVFFAVAGPQVDRTTRYVDEVGDKF